MAKGRSAGYVYGIIDPETQQIAFIGNALQPWKSIKRHLLGSSGAPAVTKWLRQITYGKCIEVLEGIVVEKYDNPKLRLPKTKEDCVRIEWVVLGVEPFTEENIR